MPNLMSAVVRLLNKVRAFLSLIDDVLQITERIFGNGQAPQNQPPMTYDIESGVPGRVQEINDQPSYVQTNQNALIGCGTAPPFLNCRLLPPILSFPPPLPPSLQSSPPRISVFISP